MNRTTAYNHWKRLESRMRDIHSRARAFSMTHDEILRETGNSIWADPSLKKCPSWVQNRLAQLSLCLLDDLYKRPERNELVWVLYEDGERVTHDTVRVWENVRGRHEWTKTGKPFNHPEVASPSSLGGEALTQGGTDELPAVQDSHVGARCDAGSDGPEGVEPGRSGQGLRS